MGTKQDISLAAMSLLLTGLTYANYSTPVNLSAADLTCEDVECAPPGKCKEAGKQNVCELHCSSGPIIKCAS